MTAGGGGDPEALSLVVFATVATDPCVDGQLGVPEMHFAHLTALCEYSAWPGLAGEE
jgi:hypothetical protein